MSRRGSRGHGRAHLIDPAAVVAWKRAQGPILADGEALRPFAAELPEIVAGAIWAAFVDAAGPHKRACAGVLAATWYQVSCALLDRMRRDCPELGDVAEIPECIARLREIDQR